MSFGSYSLRTKRNTGETEKGRVGMDGGGDFRLPYPSPFTLALKSMAHFSVRCSLVYKPMDKKVFAANSASDFFSFLFLFFRR